MTHRCNVQLNSDKLKQNIIINWWPNHFTSQKEFFGKKLMVKRFGNNSRFGKNLVRTLTKFLPNGKKIW